MLMQTLELEVQRLQYELVDLGGMVEDALLESVGMLKRRDLSGAQRLIALDWSIKNKRFAIEMDCVTLIMTQGPIEDQLRVITSMLEIATELERIGEYTREIVSVPFSLVDGPLQNMLLDLHSMAIKTRGMLHKAMRAFMAGDAALARTVPGEDIEVDALYRQVYAQLLTYMRGNSLKKGNSRSLVNQARYLARICRNLERIGDQVVVICQWALFGVSGEMLEIDSRRGAASGAYVTSPDEVPPGNGAERLLCH
jgi:phosphate transport system protein